METWKEFVSWEKSTRDTIDVKKIYIDIAGDLVSGILLSQIIYWFLPGVKGKTKLRVSHNNKFWLAKKRDDWWEECRITPKQFDRAITILESKGLIETGVFKFAGTPVKHVRLKEDMILQGVKSILTKGESPYLPLGNMDFDERGKSSYIDYNIDYNIDTTSQLKDCEITNIKESPVYNEDSMPYKTAILFYENIIINDAKFKKPNIQKWAIELDRLNRIDGRSWDEIEKLIYFVQDDEFEKTNVLSPQKLRKRYTNLLLKMNKRRPINRRPINKPKYNAYTGSVHKETGLCEYCDKNECADNENYCNVCIKRFCEKKDDFNWGDDIKECIKRNIEKNLSVKFSEGEE